ncbi:hypothetical protein [Wenzhouxiangella marina]|uniref:Uncharacterized protein n=1 Tax=Wenzhouxiangella marina TaxID=1579979 RepID=A0A0K0XRZ3_9GAMM|nr:hypothetical protein [Wenzhouxiangella marina]AKS40425.1 hypothetical protein WM2015_34 [Wenzhouxiangella marina]MBB6088253.1 mono/diheme cytochrome c family protein [Wenzhouxiangella marina]
MLIRSLLLGSCLCLPVWASDTGGEPGLIRNMMDMQYFSHKLGLAIDAGHIELADFYAHEIEETLEQAASIESYKGQPVGQLVEGMLEPAFERLEDALDEAPDQASARFDALIQACNACHQATGFGLIRLQRRHDNPFMQDFSRPE